MLLCIERLFQFYKLIWNYLRFGLFSNLNLLKTNPKSICLSMFLVSRFYEEVVC